MITKSISTEFYEELFKLIRNEIRNLEASKDAQRRDDCLELDARRAASQCYESVCIAIEENINSN